MANGWLGPGDRPDVSEWGQTLACPYCGRGGFRSEAELQEHIARYHEPGQYIPEEGYSIIIPGELVRGDDGNFYDYKQFIDFYAGNIAEMSKIVQPIHPDIAQQMVAEYQASMAPEPPEAPELKLTPIGETTIEGYVYLQYEDQFGEVHTDPKPIGKADEVRDRFLRVESIGGYDFPVYEKPDGTTYVGDDAYGRTPKTAEEAGEMSEWQQWQSEFIPYEFEQEQEQERWRLEEQFRQGEQDYELNKWSLEQDFNQAQQKLDSDLAYQEWQMGYIPYEAQQEYELNRWKLEQEFELQRQNLELSQAQLQQEQANYLADLSAHPRSWLEYSAAAGTTPVVQPWMMPLSSQEYPEYGGLQAGQPISGWPTQEELEAYAPPAYSPVDMGTTPISPAPEYTPFIPPTTPPFDERYPQPGGITPFEYTPPVGGEYTPAPEVSPFTPSPFTLSPYTPSGGGLLTQDEMSRLATGTMTNAELMAMDPEKRATCEEYAMEAKRAIDTEFRSIAGLMTDEQLQSLGSGYRVGFDYGTTVIKDPGIRDALADTLYQLSLDYPDLGINPDVDKTAFWRDIRNELKKRGVEPLTGSEDDYYNIHRQRPNYEPPEETEPEVQPAPIPTPHIPSPVVEPYSPKYYEEQAGIYERGGIPRLQYGGWVNKPTLAMIGEKEPELVTPLSQLNQWNRKPPMSPEEYRATLPKGSVSKRLFQPGYTPPNTQTPTTTASSRYGDLTGYEVGYLQNALAQLGTKGGFTEEDILGMRGGREALYGGTPSQYTPPATQYAPPSGGVSTGGGYPGINDPYYPLGGLPQLTRPSRQYQARMGPTAQAQYEAYMQATTGITPEELQWRLWNLAPPGGQYTGLRYTR